MHFASLILFLNLVVVIYTATTRNKKILMPFRGALLEIRLWGNPNVPSYRQYGPEPRARAPGEHDATTRNPHECAQGANVRVTKHVPREV